MPPQQTVIDLGQKVKAKYPGAYDDLTDEDVGKKVKIKYPGAYDDFIDLPEQPQTPPPDPNEQPSFNASIGGAETIPTNIAKTFGNIPSNVNSLLNETVAKPLQNIKDSAIAVKDIYKDRGYMQGSQDIGEGIADTATKIFKAPGEFLVGQANKSSLQNKLSPIQDQALKQRDEIIKKLADAHAQGKDTSHLVLALKYNQENLDSLNTQIDTKENRDMAGVNLATKVAKYPIERPLDIPLAIAGGGKAGEKDLIADIAKPVTQAGKATVNYAKDSLLGRTIEKKAADDLVKIQKSIAPPETSKEIRLAQSQGRLVAGKPETWFKNSTPDMILPSKNIEKAGTLIQKEIPNAAKLTDPELHAAIKTKTTEIAQKLKPEMRDVPVNRQTINKIDNDWKILKKEQIVKADATEELNVMKEQQNFEQRLMRTKTQSMDDLWDARKSYDDSIAENVKKANSQSSDSLQSKKARWLENREILNSAINDSKNGLGKTSSQAFDDMSLLYDAKENLIAKSKLNVDIKTSKLYQKLTGKTAKQIGIGTGIVTGAGTLIYGAKKVFANPNK